MSRSTPVKLDLISSIANFGGLLRYLRQRAQLTQRELAIATGYSNSLISRLEQNERLPDEMTLLAVFVPALGLQQEPATVERLLVLARQTRGATVISPVLPESNSKPALHQQATPRAAHRLINLPHRLTSFIGRDQDVIALQRLVKSNRLVTLTGVGGVGKSSLALVVAQATTEWQTTRLPDMPYFSDGVWLLELAPVSEAGLVMRLLVDLFRLSEFPGGTPLEAVISFLQHKELLLIIDNCEHLIATCAELVDRLLRSSATLHVLATSREALNVAGECEWPVLPLPTPNHTVADLSAWPLQQLQTFTAAQLFIERAQAVKTDLSFTDQDVPLIAQLCQQVDGIPLALELAAARCKSFTLQEIVARLQDRFALLSAGRRTAMLRHQSLRATIDWSYDLLSPAEATLFRSLSVFAGGWVAAAAEQVATVGQGHPPTFELLHQLVNKSLIVIDHRGGTSRYRMLETIRQYASEKLQEYDETTAVRSRHFAWYLAQVEKVLPTTLLGAQFEQWCNEVKADLDNLRVALSWSQTQADRGEKCLRLATALGPFWQLRENVSEGSAWLESALRYAGPKNTGPENAELYSWGLIWLSYTLLYATPHSFDLATEALQRFTVLNQPNGIAAANLLLGKWATMGGESAKAIDYLQESLRRFETKQFLFFLDEIYFYLADAFLLAGKNEQALSYYLLNIQLGEDVDDYVVVTSALEGIATIDSPQAIALYQKQITEQRQQQNQTRVATLLHSLGKVFTFAGDLPGALAALTEGLALWQTLGVLWSPAGGTARTYLELALVQYLHQEYQEAIVYAQKAAQQYQETSALNGKALAYLTFGYSALAINELTLALSSFHKCLHLATGKDLNCAYMALVGLAEIARRQAKLELAACLFGVTERFTQRLTPIDGRWKDAFSRPLITAAHTQLRDSAYTASWAEGQAMSLDQALQMALTFDHLRRSVVIS